jgi:hypothetical protein
MRLCMILAIVAFLASSVAGQEFVIKFDEVGYDNVPAEVKNPEDKVFRSLQVLATLDSQFAVRIADKKESVTAQGSLKRGEDGHYIVAFRHSVLKSHDDGTKAQQTSESEVNLRLDERFEAGALVSKVKRSVGKTDERQSKRALTIMLSKPVDVW